MASTFQVFEMTGKGICIWTYPGSQEWRLVGGLILYEALMKVGAPHKFIYSAADEPGEINRIDSSSRERKQEANFSKTRSN